MYIYIYYIYIYICIHPSQPSKMNCPSLQTHISQRSSTISNLKKLPKQHSKLIFLSGVRWPLVDPSMLTPKTISHFLPPGYQLKGDVRWTAMDPAPALLRKIALKSWGLQMAWKAKVDGWNKWMDWNGFLNVQFFFVKVFFPQNFGWISGWFRVKIGTQIPFGNS